LDRDSRARDLLKEGTVYTVEKARRPALVQTRLAGAPDGRGLQDQQRTHVKDVDAKFDGKASATDVGAEVRSLDGTGLLAVMRDQVPDNGQAAGGALVNAFKTVSSVSGPQGREPRVGGGKSGAWRPVGDCREW
jgi:hypothetical protein